MTTVNLGGRLPVWLDYDGDKNSDFVMTQYGGIAKLYRQSSPGFFTETTSNARLLCKRFHYGQLIDVTGDGRVDFLCSDEELFPQKIYSTLPFPWKKVFDNATPAPYLPAVSQVVDSALGDFNNDGRMDLFVLGNVQLHPSTTVQGSSTHFESQLMNGIKGFVFVTAGKVTFDVDWNKQDAVPRRSLRRSRSGFVAAPCRCPVHARSVEPGGARDAAGADRGGPDSGHADRLQSTTKKWTVVIYSQLTETSPTVFSEAYISVDSTAAITNLASTGQWAGDKAGRPTLLTNYSGGFLDETVRAGLDTPVQCVSVTPGDFDNDMDVDLYLACRTGAQQPTEHTL